ncbi:unnamed protein product [Chondrus crispus]|uniref:Uncharacterized protein n=1 Tax=Chondrus crispus TaxID=2769 RepID=R7QT53_CHOCR|nr:unnamed protein product [Chondrus crispus]CDF40530.1 unnamed protein product [Chondrus crispus]|eukprot:XP_005710824.1 unnamed protein product [Chondrus crispus]
MVCCTAHPHPRSKNKKLTRKIERAQRPLGPRHPDLLGKHYLNGCPDTSIRFPRTPPAAPPFLPCALPTIARSMLCSCQRADRTSHLTVVFVVAVARGTTNRNRQHKNHSALQYARYCHKRRARDENS